MTIFSQGQGLGKFALCALILPDKSLLFVTWAVKGSSLCLPDALIFTFSMVRISPSMMEMISVLPLILVCIGSDDFDFKDAEHSSSELSGSCWSSGPGRRKLLGPDPCCVTCFITGVSARHPSHQRFFLYTQGERWASLRGS